MNYLLKPVLLAAIALVGVAGPADGAVRKCVVTRSGVPVTGQVVFVDGVLFSEAPVGSSFGVGQVPGSSTLREGNYMVGTQLACLEVERAGETVGRVAIMIFTRDGAVGAMSLYLEDLIEAQEEHRVARGAYAESLDALRWTMESPARWKACPTASQSCVPSRPSFAVEMVASGEEWSATAMLPLKVSVARVVGEQELSCAVTVQRGDARSNPRRPGSGRVLGRAHLVRTPSVVELTCQ